MSCLCQQIDRQFGAFIEAATIFRSRNLASAIQTPFNDVRFRYGPLYHETEFHELARQSVSVRARHADGDADF